MKIIKPAATTRPIPAGADPFDPLPGATPVNIVDLAPHHCRWPVNGGGSCGCQRLENSPYCDTHYAISTPGSPGRPAQAA